MQVTAIIVARGGSRRVPGKAMRPFGGSTLIGHKIAQLKACEKINDIVVGSDDDAILAEAARCGASVRRRDAYHCDESVCSANDMIRDMVAKVDTDIVVWTHPTNPLCTTDIYDRAVEAYFAPGLTGGFQDSLCSVTKVQRHAWQMGQPANFNPWGDRHPFASELEPTYYQNGAIFIQPRQQMLDNGYFYGRRPLLFEIDQPYDMDVDTEIDLLTAQSIFTGFKQAKVHPREAVPC